MAAAPDDRVPADAIQFDTPDTNPAELYDDAGDIPLYDDNVSGGDGLEAYQQSVEMYAGDSQERYGGVPATAATPAIQQYVDTMADYDNAAVTIDAETGAYILKDEYDADDLEPVEHVDEDLEVYADMMKQYGLDPEEGWQPADGSYGLDEVAALLEGGSDDMNDVEARGKNEYVTAVSDGDMPVPETYERYLVDADGDLYLEAANVSIEEEGDARYPDLPVVEHEMPDGLFGFVDPTASHPVAHVNKALYKVDKKRTRSHESSRDTGHPSNWADNELAIRYKNGDIDVKNTLSFKANNPSRIQNVETGYMPHMEQSASGFAGTQQYTPA